jgi:hypothetical protein
MAVGTGRNAGDPLADAVGERAAAVERNRDLHAHPGALALHAREESDVELARLIAERPFHHLDAGTAQARQALAGDERVRIFDRVDDSADAGRHQRVTARRRAAVVRAGFERDEHRCAGNTFAL